MAATVNPCGFALLPAYLAYYLGMTEEDPALAPPRRSGAARAALVGASMTAGFLVVFGTVGLVWSSISSVVAERLPWVTAVMGVLLVGLGLAMLLGFQPSTRLPKLVVAKGDVQVRSMFLFGISYAVASLSCTIPLFVGLLGASFENSFASGLAGFIAYGLGMGALVTVLTVAVAFARDGLILKLRRLMPYVTRISGGLLVVAGAVVAWYGWAETRATAPGFARWLQNIQGDVTGWITRVGAIRVGLVSLVLVATAIALGAARSPSRRQSHDDAHSNVR